MATKLVLLERVESLGKLGDVVTVRPGYARNFLLPQKKALRATKENIAYFEAQRKVIEAESDKRKKAAEKIAKTIDGTKAPVIRQASEGGQLFGSVTARDIANEVSNATGEKIDRTMIELNQNFKTVGLFPVNVRLHPEVVVSVTVNIARSNEEAKIQAETGKALIVEETQAAKDAAAAAQLEAMLEQQALDATKAKEAAEAAQSAEESAESAAKSKARAEKKAKRKAEESSETPTAEAENESAG